MDAVHANALSRAVSAVLTTPIAEFTLAQIIDGLPTLDTHLDRYHVTLHPKHPLRQHTQLCPGVLQKMRDICSNFNLRMVNFEPRLTAAFQNAPEETREFKMRLIEMTTVAIHEIASLLFKIDTSLHKNDSVLSWIPDEHGRFSYLRTPSPTFFYHCDYTCIHQYPEGIADMVGYWAENRIFGGVVLFDRGESGFECNDIYFHSDRHEVTFRIYKLLDSQVDRLWKLLRSGHQGTASPLPILGDKHNKERVDPEDAIEVHGIFRDHWERQVVVRTPERSGHEREIQSPLNYPELEEQREALNALWLSQRSGR